MDKFTFTRFESQNTQELKGFLQEDAENYDKLKNKDRNNSMPKFALIREGKSSDNVIRNVSFITGNTSDIDGTASEISEGFTSPYVKSHDPNKRFFFPQPKMEDSKSKKFGVPPLRLESLKTANEILKEKNTPKFASKKRLTNLSVGQSPLLLNAFMFSKVKRIALCILILFNQSPRETNHRALETEKLRKQNLQVFF